MSGLSWQTGRVVFLMGATGTGKSRLAVRLSQRLPTEIISVDSTLVYRGAKIGAASPSASTLREVQHHLIGVRNLKDGYSVAQFQADASRKIVEIQSRGKIPVLVGGTGMYFRALENGLHNLPDRNEAIRHDLSVIMDKFGVSRLHDMLAAIDPESARRINKNDSHRLMRAIEVYKASGKTMTDLFARAKKATGIFPIKFVLSSRSKEELVSAVTERFDDMLERGLVNEVCALLKAVSSVEDNQLLKSVGYKQVRDYLLGETNYLEMRRRSIVATCQLAKRQRTWFRKEVGAVWCDSESVGSDLTTMVDLICSDMRDIASAQLVQWPDSLN